MIIISNGGGQPPPLWHWTASCHCQCVRYEVRGPTDFQSLNKPTYLPQPYVNIQLTLIGNQTGWLQAQCSPQWGFSGSVECSIKAALHQSVTWTKVNSKRIKTLWNSIMTQTWHPGEGGFYDVLFEVFGISISFFSTYCSSPLDWLGQLTTRVISLSKAWCINIATAFTILTCVCLWHRSGFEFLIHKVEIMTRTGPSAKMRSSYHISGCVSESILSHTALVKPLHFANCKVKTTVRERAFFISRMLAFGDFEAKCLRLLLKKQNKGTSGHDGWPF